MAEGIDMHGMKTTTLLVMTAVHFPIMYLVMFTMIDSIAEYHNKVNMAYMAGMMTAPMLIIEVLLMRKMYENKKALLAIGPASVVVFLVLFLLIRHQTAVGDNQFLKSTIPHHSGALLMCKEAELRDPEVKALCDAILKSQRREIEQMEAILERLDK
jgi:uncharacterized protein (DUF305 family)